MWAGFHTDSRDMLLFVKHPFSFLTLFLWNFARVPCLECSNIFNDLYFLIKRQRCAKEHSTISATDRDYSTLGVLLMPCNTILDEPLMFWHDWLTKTPPIKATYRRKWDLWGVEGSTSVTVYEGRGGGFVEEGVVSEDSRCLSRKSELALTQETDEQCVRALWFMDRTLFSGCWGFHWNKRRNSLRRSNWQLCQFTVTTVQISNCQAMWEKVPSKRRGRLDLRKRQTVLSCFCESTTSCAFYHYRPQLQLLLDQTVTAQATWAQLS